MKSLLIIVVSVLLYTNNTYAQQTPKVVTDAFKKSYPAATKVKWEKEDNQYEVNFNNNGQETSVLYNKDGTAAETEITIASNDLPAAAKSYASSKGKIQEAAKITTASGKVEYEAKVKGKDLMFDDKGNFITQKAEAEKD